MPKFSGTKRRPLRTNLTAPVATTTERTRTFEGGDAFARDPESELFTLAVTNMVGETRSTSAPTSVTSASSTSYTPSPPRTRRSSPVPTSRGARSVWRSTCARRCLCARPPS